MCIQNKQENLQYPNAKILKSRKICLTKVSKSLCVCVCVCALSKPSVPWIHYAGSQNIKLTFLHSCLLPPSSPRKCPSLDSKNNTKPNELFGIVVSESCEHHNQRTQCRVCCPAGWTTDGISGRRGSWFRDVCTQPILLLIKGGKNQSSIDFPLKFPIFFMRWMTLFICQTGSLFLYVVL